MDSEKIISPGFSTMDVCVIYEPATSAERPGRKMRQVARKPSNIIYTYINRSLTDAVADSAVSRLRQFLNSTFYDNSYALQCTVAALSMALIGGNVDRAFCGIESGGVGQSLFYVINPKLDKPDAWVLRLRCSLFRGRASGNDGTYHRIPLTDSAGRN